MTRPLAAARALLTMAKPLAAAGALNTLALPVAAAWAAIPAAGTEAAVAVPMPVQAAKNAAPSAVLPATATYPVLDAAVHGRTADPAQAVLFAEIPLFLPADGGPFLRPCGVAPAVPDALDRASADPGARAVAFRYVARASYWVGKCQRRQGRGRQDGKKSLKRLIFLIPLGASPRGPGNVPSPFHREA
ncbi:MAG: hypothetical protein LBQ12_08235 [Deltaproteobacteria bacterium]|jgi:hypothetical protein|nr:hypothetical protein [Deltaproteobacteria bacterium]